MGAMAINMAEKRLLTHLRMGGSPSDAVGKELVRKFADTAHNDTTVSGILRSSNMTRDEVAEFYASVIERLMPQPWMNAGGPMLVPTQWFMEPHRLEELLASAARDVPSRERPSWMNALIENATELAVATRAAHDSQYGKPNVSVSQSGGLKSSGGCASVIIVGIITSALVVIL